MSRVFILNCDIVWSSTTPAAKSLKYNEDSLYPPALQESTSSYFPLAWAFASMRAITKICNLVEQRDSGITPIALFDVDSNESKCEVAVRVRASLLAIKFLVRFLHSFDGWNSVKFYPIELTHLGNSNNETKIVHRSGCKNICSSAFSTLCKITKANMDDSNRRFWWQRVEKLENLIFVSTLRVLRNETSNSWSLGVLTMARREEAKILEKDQELQRIVANWNKQSLSLQLDAAAPVAAVATTETTETTETTAKQVAAAPVVAAPQHEKTRISKFDFDLKRLRSCNFPPRLAPNTTFRTWEPCVPSLSAIVFDPIPNYPSVPIGLKMRRDVCLLKSIW